MARAPEPGKSIMTNNEPTTMRHIMQVTAELFLSGRHVSVERIAQVSKKSRASIHAIFGKEREDVPTVKVIEEKIITDVLEQTRATMLMFLAAQGPLAATNPLQQLITVFRAVMFVFNSNPLGRFVAHRLTDPHENEILASIFFHVDKLFLAARNAGQLEEPVDLDLRKLRLMLFGILRGFLTLLPTEEQPPAPKAPSRVRATRGKKPAALKTQSETLTVKDIELEFLKLFQIHVNENWKALVSENIAAVRNA
jgi:hypothetical protein